jgi:hypothetical protein
VFERFTRAASAAVDRARREAEALGHGRVGPEHLLLGILTDATEPTAAALLAHGVTADQLRSELAPAAGTATEHLSFTVEAKQVFRDALLEARRLRRPDIGTVHLVLAILRDDTSIASRFLVDEHDVDYGTVWNELGGLAPLQTRPFLRAPVQFPKDVVSTYRRRHLVADVQELLDENVRLRRLLRRHGIDPDADPGTAGEQPA